MATSTTAAAPPARPDPAKPLMAKRVRIAKYDIEVGPLGHLAAERARLAALTWAHFDVRPLGATIGAEIAGVDLSRELPDDVIAEIRRALHAYKVIFFRRQALTAARHVAFARRFGELEVHPFLGSNTGQPELVRFEKSADVGGYENGWHHDVTWRERPSMGAVLHALRVPANGGDTLFADMCAAYDGLDEATRDRIEGLTAVHDYVQVFGRTIAEEKQAEMRASYPPVEHPVVCTHAETGRRHVYVNRFFTSHIVGLERDESTALINRLARRAELAEYQCRFQWENDSVAFWDNRAVQHYAASDYWPDVRIMERASIVGSRPAR
jgi:alpha-ketoglutarate-dependent taurine dioxygenase